MKSGFTLAEVLITLGIIGVVAAITMPSLSINAQKQQAGPSLMKAINILEQANKLVMHNNESRNMTSACGGDLSNYLGCIGDYLNSTPADIPDNSYKRWNLSTAAIGAYRGGGGEHHLMPTRGSAAAVTTKDNITYIYQMHQSMGQWPLYKLYVDINGVGKGPNIIGKDTFRLALGNDGSVIPYGGREYMASGASESVLWETSCANNETPTDGETCAGAIVDNGGTVKYKW